MVSIAQFQHGVTMYIDREIVSKLGGWQKWAFGAGAGALMTKFPEMVNSLKQDQLVQMMGVINENDEIDVDLLHEQLGEQARRNGAVTFNVPLIGALTLNEGDVDRAYHYIVNGG